MSRRVKPKTVRNWAIGSGLVGIPILIGIFVMLSSQGSITILDYSSDMMCAGTEDDPCIAEITFIPNEDIFIYTFLQPDRTVLLNTDVKLKDMKMQRKWGDGWRTINLEEGCTGSWCGCYWCRKNIKSVYSYAFRKNKEYTVRFLGYKNDPFDDVKWSFGWNGTDYEVDPVWFGIGDYKPIKGEIAGVEYDPNSFTVLHIPVNVSFKNNLKFKNEDVLNRLSVSKGNPKISEYGVKYLNNRSYTETIKINKKICNPYGKIVNGSVQNHYCYIDTTYRDVEKWEYEWIEIDKEFEMVKGQNYILDFWFKRKPSTEKFNVDIIPRIKSYEMPKLAWWNATFGYRYPIYNNYTTNEYPTAINKTVCGDVLWALIGNSSYLYCTVQNCCNGDIAVANQTDEKKWENETDFDGFKPTEIWDKNYMFIYHLANGTDSGQNSNTMTKGNTPVLATGKLGQGTDFERNDNDYFTFGSGNDMSNQNSAYVFEGWFKVESVGIKAYLIYSITDQDGYEEIRMHTNSSLLMYHEKDGAGVNSALAYTEAINTGEWHYFFTTWNGTYVDSYLDGDLVLSKAVNAIWYGRDRMISIGGDDNENDDYFDGVMDEMRYSNVTRTKEYMFMQYFNGLGNASFLGTEESGAIATSMSLFLNKTESNSTITYGNGVNITGEIDTSGIPIEIFQNGTSLGTGITSLETSLGKPELANGTYNITSEWEGNDTYDASSATYWIHVEKSPSFLNLYINGSESNITINYGESINITSVTNTSNYIEMFKEDELFANMTTPTENITDSSWFANATYNITANIWNDNYTSNTVEYYVHVKKSTPDINLYLNGSENLTYYVPTIINSTCYSSDVDDFILYKNSSYLLYNMTSTEDARVLQGTPNTNYGNGTTLKVSRWFSGGNKYQRSYIKINATKFNEFGGELFYVYADNGISGANKLNISLAYINDSTQTSWSENSITWNTQPCGSVDNGRSINGSCKISEDPNSFHSFTVDDPGWISFNVSECILNNISGFCHAVLYSNQTLISTFDDSSNIQSKESTNYRINAPNFYINETSYGVWNYTCEIPASQNYTSNSLTYWAKILKNIKLNFPEHFLYPIENTTTESENPNSYWDKSWNLISGGISTIDNTTITVNNESNSDWNETFIGDQNQTYWIQLPKDSIVTESNITITGYSNGSVENKYNNEILWNNTPYSTYDCGFGGNTSHVTLKRRFCWLKYYNTTHDFYADRIDFPSEIYTEGTDIPDTFDMKLCSLTNGYDVTCDTTIDTQYDIDKDSPVVNFTETRFNRSTWYGFYVYYDSDNDGSADDITGRVFWPGTPTGTTQNRVSYWNGTDWGNGTAGPQYYNATLGNSTNDDWAKLYGDYYPINVSIDVGNNSVFEWKYYDIFKHTNSTINMTNTTNTYLSTCTEDSNGYCDVPVLVHSIKSGKINFKNLSLIYYLSVGANGTIMYPRYSWYKFNITDLAYFDNATLVSTQSSMSNSTYGSDCNSSYPCMTRVYYSNNQTWSNINWNLQPDWEPYIIDDKNSSSSSGGIIWDITNHLKSIYNNVTFMIRIPLKKIELKSANLTDMYVLTNTTEYLMNESSCDASPYYTCYYNGTFKPKGQTDSQWIINVTNPNSFSIDVSANWTEDLPTCMNHYLSTNKSLEKSVDFNISSTTACDLGSFTPGKNQTYWGFFVLENCTVGQDLNATLSFYEEI